MKVNYKKGHARRYAKTRRACKSFLPFPPLIPPRVWEAEDEFTSYMVQLPAERLPGQRDANADANATLDYI